MIEGAVLIAGPTASGKSRLALEWAERIGGVVVNTDSMQVYSGLRVLTARPDDHDLRTAPHLLYGHVDPARAYSTGQWLRDVQGLARGGRFEGRPPIFVGGTGLYFRALTEGLSEMPEIPDAVRAGWRKRLAEEGASALHDVLTTADPAMAAALKPGDGQRIVRALEVLEATGKSLATWQNKRGAPLVDSATARRLVLSIDRSALARRIDARFDQMVEQGALDEARALLARGLSFDLPAMRAIGVREFAAYLDGEITLAEAISRAKTATRQYSKRQTTWFNNQIGSDWTRVTVETKD